MRNTRNNIVVAGGDLQRKNTINYLIFKYLAFCNKSTTRRALSGSTGLEITTLYRELFNLVYRRRAVSIAEYDYCQTTGKKDMHFVLLKNGGRNDNC